MLLVVWGEGGYPCTGFFIIHLRLGYKTGLLSRLNYPIKIDIRSARKRAKKAIEFLRVNSAPSALQKVENPVLTQILISASTALHLQRSVLFRPSFSILSTEKGQINR